MASAAMAIAHAVLNAAAFTGGNYLAKYLAGDNDKAALDEKTRHDKTLEAFQTAMAKYQRERTQILDWINTNEEITRTHRRTARTPITRSSFTARRIPTRD